MLAFRLLSLAYAESRVGSLCSVLMVGSLREEILLLGCVGNVSGDARSSFDGIMVGCCVSLKFKLGLGKP